jgi:RNA polymerase sigma-70 factor (ECF subfamily)
VERRSRLDAAIRKRVEAGQTDAAATMAIQEYGPELLGFLHAILKSPADADDVFSTVCERMWTHLDGFRWSCAFRTWMYSIARNCAHNRLAARRREQARNVPLSNASQAQELAAAVRSSTAAHLRTEAKSRLRTLRDRLPPDERILLVLRLDRRLPWPEIAIVLADGDLELNALGREAARLRQRFTRLKAKVTDMLRGDGLVDDDGTPN